MEGGGTGAWGPGGQVLGSWGQKVVTQHSWRARPMAGGREGGGEPGAADPGRCPSAATAQGRGHRGETGQQLAPLETASPSPEPGATPDSDGKPPPAWPVGPWLPTAPWHLGRGGNWGPSLAFGAREERAGPGAGGGVPGPPVASGGEGLGWGESRLGCEWGGAGESELHTGEDVGAAAVPGRHPAEGTPGGRQLTCRWSGLGSQAPGPGPATPEGA